MAECLTCHEEITDFKRVSKVYCSDSCKTKAYRSRKRERTAKTGEYTKQDMVDDAKRIGIKSHAAHEYIMDILALASPENAARAIYAVFAALEDVGHKFNYKKGIWE